MSTLPEVSKLNWSYEKPNLFDIKGKYFIVEYFSSGDRFFKAFYCDEISWSYLFYFDRDDFVRYAVLDLSEPGPEPEPMELRGEKPGIREDSYNKFYLACGTEIYTGWSHIDLIKEILENILYIEAEATKGEPARLPSIVHELGDVIDKLRTITKHDEQKGA